MTQLKDVFGHTNLIFVGAKTNPCRESGKKGCIVYTTARPRGLIVFEDRTTVDLRDFNEITGTALNDKGISILAVYELPQNAHPCTISEIFNIPLRECRKLWELPRSIDDVAVDAFLKGE